MKRPEKPVMFIGNDELTQRMVTQYWLEIRQYQRSSRLLEYLIIALFLVLVAVAGAELW